MLKKISIPLNVQTQLCVLKNKFYLIFNNETLNSYLPVPKFLKFFKLNNFLYFESVDFNKYMSFFHFLNSIIRSFKKFFCKKLIFKGLGLKMNVINEKKILELKLGYSHTFFLKIPESLTLFIKKNVLSIEGWDFVLVGNFSYNIRKLKFPNIYKGKGIWYKNEIKALKIIKKT